MSCQLQAPVCKRKIMTSNKIFEKKECPTNKKQKCALNPPTCPLLTQQEVSCGYAKIMGIGDDVDVAQCPCKTCFLTEGCPISFNASKTATFSGINSEEQAKWPDNVPPCVLCTNTKDGPTDTIATEQLEKAVSERQLLEKRKAEKPHSAKDIGENAIKENNPILRKNIQVLRKCALRSPRPFPCAECISNDLNNDCEGGPKAKTCPYLVLPDICGENCLCSQVPPVEIGPPCPFRPKPCPCCATPRCPLSRSPDCILKPKPPCCLVSPKCCCRACCSARPSCQGPDPCSCGPCLVCLAPCKNSCVCCTGTPTCLLNCCSSLCSSTPRCALTCAPCPSTPCCPLKCAPCPPAPCCILKCSPCPPCNPPACALANSNCACPPPSCSLYPCTGQCCDLNPLCSVTNKPCPLIPCCSSPSCIPCQLKAIECMLNPCPITSICPPIPPPCSLQTKEVSFESGENTQEKDERTFHLPTCSLYDPPCELHNALKDKKDVCPFSPNPCPIGPKCPFPVTIKPLESKSDNVTKENTTLTRPEIDNKNEINFIKGNNMIPCSKQCPYSPTCGVVPLPDCPAAEILCPEIYKKPEKVEVKPCPFKKCLKKEGCPLSKLMPDVDCPDTKCPLKEEPECPLGELANRCPFINKCSCNCPCPVPSPCCGIRPSDGVLKLTFDCNYTTKDGGSRPIPIDSLTNTEGSISSLDSRKICSTTDFYSNIQCTSRNSISMENIYSYPSASNTSLYGVTKFDGCCSVLNARNSSSSECPFEPLAPKRICPLAPPKCPLTPKPNTCPLTRKPEPCPLSMGGEIVCPVKFPSCKKFPLGRCPMDDINVCDCDYPVSPCLLPLQDPNVVAPPQYCFKEDCCMGLTYPPTVLKTTEGEIETGPYYEFKHTKPGKEETKYYVEVLDHPPNVEIALFGKAKKRLHDNWTIIRHGEGYLRCKYVAKKIKEMDPIENDQCQYQAEDCPIDEETRMILENRKRNERAERELENLKLSLGFRETKEKTKKKKYK